MDDFDTQVQCEEVYGFDEAEAMRDVHIAELEDEIRAAKHARYCDEMSDDYCYSNGKYARHTAHINQLEAKLTSLRG
jgi:hypothetical protein